PPERTAPRRPRARARRQLSVAQLSAAVNTRRHGDRIPRRVTRMTPEQAFGRAVQALRRERGLSQERLAFESGLHRTYISLLERGLRSPKLGTIYRLAAVLAVAPSELVQRAEAVASAR